MNTKPFSKRDQLKDLDFIVYRAESGSVITFIIAGTNILFDYFSITDEMSWYISAKSEIGSNYWSKISINEVLNLVPDYIKIKILFHLDLFR